MDTVAVVVQRGEDVSGRHEESVAVSMGLLARFFGLKKANVKAGAGKTERLVFEMGGAARALIEDADLEPVLKPFLDALLYRADNRYFVIRACRTAMEVIFHLRRSQVDELGGEVSLADNWQVEGTLHTFERDGEYVLEQKFSEPFRVMFLTEEIAPIGAELAAEEPTLGLVSVREVLMWEEG